MTGDLNKENIADGLVAGSSFDNAPTSSSKKSGRKTRSKSIGPGGLGALGEAPLKESTGNRRKSAFVPAVKSILASNDVDEKKRREERRKSLARRRVSFAPEATLHTWDVVEYLRDATTSSSASSEAFRRGSSTSPAPPRAAFADSDTEESPSTPPEQVEEPQPEDSPANQRDMHQKKNRRRSSGIPPLNFNNPEDLYSSSPVNDQDSSPLGGDAGDNSSEDEGLSMIGASPSESNASTDSSARLDAALRQAVEHAGTQNLTLDDDDDVSMELAEEEITAAFKPWAKKTAGTPKSTGAATFQDQENVDPFLPAPEEVIYPKLAGNEEDDDTQDMSMDITRAIGRIVPQEQEEEANQEDTSMDLTMPLGGIQSVAQGSPAKRRQSLKRRRPSLAEESKGSPAKRSANRRTSLRQLRSAGGEPNLGEETMDLTVAIGKIQGNPAAQDNARRQSVDTSLGDETMDFTVAVGTIKSAVQTPVDNANASDEEGDEELSMELTRVMGGIKAVSQVSTTPEKALSAGAPTVVSAKTPTPRKSPKKASLASSAVKSSRTPSPKKPRQQSPSKSPGRQSKHGVTATPEVKVTPRQPKKQAEPESFVSHTPQDANGDDGSIVTPSNRVPEMDFKAIPDDPITAPILNRRRSSLSLVQFSPLAATHADQPQSSTAVLTNNIKLLSTPRKEVLASPMKRGLTPKKASTPKKTSTPKKATPRKSISPKKRVAFGEDPVAEQLGPANQLVEEEEDVERISLQEFLDMTNIRFMDLTTTKRRHTAAPSAFHDKEIDEKDESLDRYVVAAACTLPEYELYQHACHEMKKFISDGRNFVRMIEANVEEENPMLFSEYLTAPPDQRAVMDNQFKNLKTNARLQARGEWYQWRSRLLQDLKVGLLGTMEGFQRDKATLTQQEKLLDVVLPPLVEEHSQLEMECKRLQQRHDELNSCDLEELEAAREQLISIDADLEEKRKLVASLQQELLDKESQIEAAKERRIECIKETKEAERVREECRGWSATEVNELRAKVTALEHEHGWSITSASGSSITLTHLNDLELYFHPASFGTGKNGPNNSISLTYVGDSATPHSRPLTTSKRFFLQLIRAHLHCVPQSQTRISELLSIVKKGWASALAVAEGVRWLEHNFITEECILSDERMAISSYMLLYTLQTKVKVTFEIGVSLGAEGVEAQVSPSAQVVYGEKYREDRMRDFLKQFVGEEIRPVEGMNVWADAVLDLMGRLKARGKKGERV